MSSTRRRISRLRSGSPIGGSVVPFIPQIDTSALENDTSFPRSTPHSKASLTRQSLCAGPNLLLNPGAEEDLGWSSSVPWAVGFGEPDPYEGSAYFVAGTPEPGEAAELFQEVDVAIFGERIDAGQQLFELRAWVSPIRSA